MVRSHLWLKPTEEQAGQQGEAPAEATMASTEAEPHAGPSLLPPWTSPGPPGLTAPGLAEQLQRGMPFGGWVLRTPRPSSTSDVEAIIGQKTQHETDNATHKPDREDADQAIAEAKSTQDKNEPASTAAQIKPSANIAALKKTLAAMGEGATGGATDSGAAKDREARIVDREAQDLAADTTMFIDTTTQGESEVMGTLQSLVRPVQRTAFTARLEHQSQGLKHHHVLQWQSPTFL